MRQWKDVEDQFPKYRTQKEKQRFANQIRNYAIGLAVCGFIEHILVMFCSLRYAKSCKPNEDLMSAFLQHQLYELFEFTSYALLKAILGKFTNIVATFAWHYLNLFIVIVSLGISSRFRQLNHEMRRIKGQVKLLFIFPNKSHRMFKYIVASVGEILGATSKSIPETITSLCPS